MAILPSRPGIEITVKSNGAALQEYEDDDDDPQPNVVTKYVEAVSGAEFGVQWEITSPWPPYTILFEYWLDQKKVSGKYCQQIYYGRPCYSHLEEGALAVVNGQEFMHKFAFAALTVDEHDAAPIQDQLVKDIKGIGEITVKAWFVKNLQTSSTSTNRALVNSLKEVGKIPEKALKGRTLSHQTSLRAPQPTGKVTPTSICEYVDPARQPFATYTFKYRSRDALKSLLIIPRSPSPVPLEERDINTLNADEMRELLQGRRERDAAARAVKPECGIKREHERERSGTIAEDDDEISVIFTKRRREQYRTTVNENGVELIDLT